MLRVSEVEYKDFVRTLNFTLKRSTSQEGKFSSAKVTTVEHYCLAGNQSFKAAMHMVVQDEKVRNDLYYITR